MAIVIFSLKCFCSIFIAIGIVELLKAATPLLSSTEEKETVETETPTMTNLAILYDYSNGHVVQAEVYGKTRYLIHDGYQKSAQQAYCDSHAIRLPNGATYEWNEHFDFTHYKSLSDEKRKRNQQIHESTFSDEYNYYPLLSEASRYSDEELPKLEAMVKQVNRKIKYDKPLEELLSLNIVYDTDEDRDYFFDQISLKLER